MASTDSRTSWTSKEHNDLAATVAASVNSDGTLSPAAVQTALGGSLPLNAADYGVLPGASDTAVVAGLNEALTVAAENMAAAGLGPYGGKVIVPAGAYDFNGLVDVPSGVDLVGMGTYATRFNATGADAQFRFGDGGGATAVTNLGGISGGFRVWGADIATNPFFVGASVSRIFAYVELNKALGDGLRCEQAQNCAFIEFTGTNCGGSGLVVDYGCGGLKFYTSEFSINGYANGRMTHSGAVTGAGYAVNQQISFDNCRFEGPGQTASQVATFVHEAGTSTNFHDTILSQYSGAAGQAALWGTNIPVFQMTKLAAASASSRVSFTGACLLNGSAPVAGVAYKGTGIDCLNSPGQAGANVYLGAGTIIQLCDTALKIGDSSTIEADNFVVVNCTTRFAVQSGGVATEAMVVKHTGGHASLTGVDPAYPTFKTTAAAAQTANIVENYGSGGLVSSLSNSGSLALNANLTAIIAKLGRGAVGAPAFTFTNDPDCGMWSPTTNQVAFSTNGVQAILISAAQSVTVGKAVATTATDGFPYIPAAAGAPTGVPTAQAGFVPMYYDTTNHKLWIYDGGWKGVAVA